MQRVSWILFAWILISVSACQSDNSSAETEALDAMRAQVMEVHDEIMPKVMGNGELVKLEQTFESYIQAVDDNQQDTVLNMGAYREVLADLKLSKQKMDVWMENYKDPDYSKVAEAKAYYEGQLKEIQEIAGFTDQSIKAAQALVNELE